MKTQFDGKVIPGPIYAALREIKSGETINAGGFYLNSKAFSNDKLGIYKIEAIGTEAAEVTGLVIGDYVYADRLATFYNSTPLALIDYKNIIFKTNEAKSEVYPLKNRIIVEEIKDDVKDSGGFFVNTSAKPRLGKVVKMDIAPGVYPYEIGDTVMLVKGGDMISIGGKTLLIYEPDRIICKVVEETL